MNQQVAWLTADKEDTDSHAAAQHTQHVGVYVGVAACWAILVRAFQHHLALVLCSWLLSGGGWGAAAMAVACACAAFVTVFCGAACLSNFLPGDREWERQWEW